MLFGLPSHIKSISLQSNSPHRIKVPTNGGTYKQFILRFFKEDGSATTLAETKAALRSLTLEANRNRETFPLLDALSVDDFNMLMLRYGAHNGLAIVGNQIVYTPSQVYGADEYHRRILNIGTEDLTSLVWDVKTNPALGNVARLEVYAIYDENDRQNLGAHRRIGFINPPLEAGRTGKMDNISLPRYDYRFGYSAIHMQVPAGAAIGELSQKRNTNVHDFTDVPVSVFELQDKMVGRAPQTGWVHLDYAREGVPTAFLPAGFDTLEIEPNVTTASADPASVKVLYEIIELDEEMRKELIGK